MTVLYIINSTGTSEWWRRLLVSGQRPRPREVGTCRDLCPQTSSSQGSTATSCGWRLRVWWSNLPPWRPRTQTASRFAWTWPEPSSNSSLRLTLISGKHVKMSWTLRDIRHALRLSLSVTFSLRGKCNEFLPDVGERVSQAGPEGVWVQPIVIFM